MHPAANPYQALSVSTSSPAQLVTMLYDRALVAIDRARHAAAAAGDPSAAATMNFELQRAQDIVMELRFALDHERGVGIAANLQSLYGFCLDLLIRANVSKDVSRPRAGRAHAPRPAGRLGRGVLCRAGAGWLTVATVDAARSTPTRHHRRAGTCRRDRASRPSPPPWRGPPSLRRDPTDCRTGAVRRAASRAEACIGRGSPRACWSAPHASTTCAAPAAAARAYGRVGHLASPNGDRDGRTLKTVRPGRPASQTTEARNPGITDDPPPPRRRISRGPCSRARTLGGRVPATSISDGAMRGLEYALDGVKTRMDVHADNLTNVNTPGFRSRRVDFEANLRQAMATDGSTAAPAPRFATRWGCRTRRATP